MKRILIFTVISCIAILSSCRKSDNPKLPDITNFPVPKLQVDANSSLIIQDDAQKASFKSTFYVNLYFPEDVRPKKYDIIVAKNGNYNELKTYQTDLTEIGAPIEVTTVKLAQLFGMSMDQLVPGTIFEVRAQLTLQDGTVIPAFNKEGSTYSPDITNLPGASLTLKYQVVCPLSLDDFTGSFVAFEDAFWEETYPVTIAKEGTSSLKVSNFIDQPGASIIIDVDQVNRTVSVKKQVYLKGPFIGYTNFTIVGNGEIDACNTEIRFTGAYTVDQGSFGSYPVRLKRP